MSAIVILDYATNQIVVAGDVDVFLHKDGSIGPALVSVDFQKIRHLLGNIPVEHIDARPTPEQLRWQAANNNGKPPLTVHTRAVGDPTLLPCDCGDPTEIFP